MNDNLPGLDEGQVEVLLIAAQDGYIPDASNGPYGQEFAQAAESLVLFGLLERYSDGYGITQAGADAAPAYADGDRCPR